ncbi:MAG: 50S ribosomal protein L28 [Planctomycetota bacterium]
MPRVCEFTGKRTTVGNTYVRRGKAKRLGGVGLKIRGKNKRTFRPNIQTINALMPDGSVRKVKASTRAIKSGLVVKPAKRKYAYKPEADSAAA